MIVIDDVVLPLVIVVEEVEGVPSVDQLIVYVWSA
jgi:hypothetical protein